MLYTLANNSSVVKPGQQARGGGLIGTSSLTTRGGGFGLLKPGNGVSWLVLLMSSFKIIRLR